MMTSAVNAKLNGVFIEAPIPVKFQSTEVLKRQGWLRCRRRYADDILSNTLSWKKVTMKFIAKDPIDN